MHVRYYLLFFIILVFRGNLTAQSYTVNQRIYWLSKIWKDVSHNYCDPNRLLEINWDSCFVSSVSAVMNPMTDREYYKLLEKLIATIQDGHTQLDYRQYWTSDKEIDYLPIDIEYNVDEFYINGVSDKIKNAVPLGSLLLKINDIPTEQYLEKYTFPYTAGSTLQNRKRQAIASIACGNKNDSILLCIKTPSGDINNVYIKYNVIEERVAKKDMLALFNSNIINNYKRTDAYLKKDSFDNSYFYFRFDRLVRFSMTNLLNSVVKQVGKADYLVLDLRYCSGGNELMGDTLLMSFLDVEKMETYPSVTRVNNAFYASRGFGYKQYVDYYENMKVDTLSSETLYKTNLPLFKQPLFILIGDRTLSAAEDLLIALKLHFPQRAILVGTPSGGSTGAPLVYKLPFHNSYYRICVRKPLLPLGMFEDGIQPDYFYKPSIQSVLEGKDEIFNCVQKIYENEIK